MEIILKEDIKGLGYKNDVVSVKPGYGRNYLIPQKLGIIANGSNKKVLAENLKQAAHKLEQVKKDAEALSASIGELEISISTKAGETGKIFGAVTAVQVAEALADKGFDVDRRKISFPEEIKVLGTFVANLDLHKAVKRDIKVTVVAE